METNTLNTLSLTLVAFVEATRRNGGAFGVLRWPEGEWKVTTSSCTAPLPPPEALMPLPPVPTSLCPRISSALTSSYHHSAHLLPPQQPQPRLQPGPRRPLPAPQRGGVPVNVPARHSQAVPILLRRRRGPQRARHARLSTRHRRPRRPAFERRGVPLQDDPRWYRRARPGRGRSEHAGVARAGGGAPKRR